jgi:hypothetical protein
VISAELLAQFEQTISEPRLARRIHPLTSRALIKVNDEHRNKPQEM